ncbi:hypothetical protein Q2T40_16900 [Winogradskyella maritima]|nr:hypothetical protein [Winogradskyella maritima]
MSVIFISCSNTSNSKVSNQSEEGVQLNWKVSENDTLVYRTVINQIEDSSQDILNGIDSVNSKNDNFSREFYEKIKGLYNDTNLTTTLTNSKNFDNVLNIETIAGSRKNDSIKNSSQPTPLIAGTVLRGSIYKTGSLHSFWLKRTQKNVVSLFFELPEKHLEKGDSWSLNNVNFLNNSQDFICRKAEKKNHITLNEIIEKEGRSVAIIEYDLLEFVSGESSSTSLFSTKEEGTKTEMTFVFKAQAEFSIDEGKWISYNGIMSLKSSGMINLNQKQKFALIEQD